MGSFFLFVIFIAFIWFGIKGMSSMSKDNKKIDEEFRKIKQAREAEEAMAIRTREAKEAEAIRAIEEHHQQMVTFTRTANENAKSVNEYYYKILDTIPLASSALTKAEEEFCGGYYAPFWDQIEIATNDLVAYNNYLQKINYCIDQYRDILKQLDDEYTEKVSACVLPGKLPDPVIVADRLSKTVRMAQRNYEFSTIYEQRKTNTLLYHGFRNLGDAIYSLGDRITDSINELSHNLNSSLEAIISATNENSRIVSDNILEQTDRINEHAKAQREYESDSLKKLHEQQKTLEQQKRVLDSQNRRINNIQRGRKPGLFDE
jgi:hypothetical protein